QETEYESLFTFRSDKTGEKYLVFTENSFDEDADEGLYVLRLEAEEEDGEIKGYHTAEIETDEEWAIIEAELAEMDDILDGGYDGGGMVGWPRVSSVSEEYFETREDDDD
ncbi:MAG: DUF1292 domain-containing protein, partial [Lachnospiraceae bacterium]|nr:DUF1292 domain-containing protein [Lachnospiraceae bacterium]